MAIIHVKATIIHLELCEWLLEAIGDSNYTSTLQSERIRLKTLLSRFMITQCKLQQVWEHFRQSSVT